MLRFIAMLGGLLLMMGRQTRSESLFYYFRLEDQVPENHLLRLIDRYVSFEFVREKLRESYSWMSDHMLASWCPRTRRERSSRRARHRSNDNGNNPAQH